MSGSIEEVPLPDLLQLFGTSKKSGVLVIRTEDDVGRIYLKKGNIAFAIINDLDDVQPLKSLYRMLTWQKGLFDLDPPEEREFPNEMNISVQEILMEGMRQLDEFNRIREAELPGPGRARSSIQRAAHPAAARAQARGAGRAAARAQLRAPSRRCSTRAWRRTSRPPRSC